MKRSFLGLCVLGLVGVVSACAGNGDRDGGDESCGDLPACPEGLSCCGAICVSTTIDRGNCGFCGNACDPGQSCSAGSCTGTAIDSGPFVRRDGGPVEPPGMCMPTCSSSQTCCGTTCVYREYMSGAGRPADPREDSSFSNCGACGLECDPMRADTCARPPTGGGAPECRCGMFRQCFPEEVCASSGGSVRCITLRSDPENCGEIGRACSGDEICSMGNCVCGSTGGPCPAGSSCCGGACIDTTADAMNCGGCGMTCTGTGTGCRDSMCVCGDGPGCRPAAGTDLGQLCCGDMCVAQDTNNCGGCGTTCNAEDGEMCALGMDVFGGGGMRICCAMAGFPGFPAFCVPGGGMMGFPDGGFGP